MAFEPPSVGRLLSPMKRLVSTMLAVAILFSLAFNFLSSPVYVRNEERILSPTARTQRTTTARAKGFSACLLLMDDNHFLIEWLAYHYHVLKLKNLVVAVDPRSKTSPKPILERWTNRMNITLWDSDAAYMGNKTELDEAESWVRIKFKSDAPSPELIRHRARQRLFYYRCLQEHKRSNRTWTALIDTDEFLRINYETLAQQRPNEARPQDIMTPGSVLDFLQREKILHPDSNVSISPCIQIPRCRFGAVEDSARFPPGPFNTSDFSTLRWLYHANHKNYKYNRISKVVIDLSRIDWVDLEPVDSIHRPIRKYCARRKLHIQANDQLLVIHHYLGSWEQYSYRQDAREGKERSQEMFKKTAKVADEYSQEIVPWLGGFIREVGLNEAKLLLVDAGKSGRG